MVLSVNHSIDMVLMSLDHKYLFILMNVPHSEVFIISSTDHDSTVWTEHCTSDYIVMAFESLDELEFI